MSIDTDRLSERVQTFVANIRHVQGAALVTVEGLPVVGTLPPGFNEAKTAAMAAAAITIGDRIGQELQRGVVQHIWVEGTNGYSILALCGHETLLLVLANLEAKQGLLTLEIRRLIEEIVPLLS